MMMMMMMKAALLLMALSMPLVLSGASKCRDAVDLARDKFCGKEMDKCSKAAHIYWTLADETCQCETSKKILNEKGHNDCMKCRDVKTLKDNIEECSCHKLGCKCPKPKNSCVLYGPKYHPSKDGYSSSDSGQLGYYAYDSASYGGDGYMQTNYGYGSYSPDYHPSYEGYEEGSYGYGDNNEPCSWYQVKDYYQMGNKDEICPEQKEYETELNNCKNEQATAHKKYGDLELKYGNLLKQQKQHVLKDEADNDAGNAEDIQTAAASASTGEIMAILLPMAYWFS